MAGVLRLETAGLEQFVLTDRAMSESRNLLIHLIKSTKPAVDADVSAANREAIDAEVSASHHLVGSPKLVLAKRSDADPATIGDELSAFGSSNVVLVKRSDADPGTIDDELSASRHLVGSSNVVLAKRSDADPGTIDDVELSASRHLVGSPNVVLAKRSAAPSASHAIGSAKRSAKKYRVSTDVTSPDYGTGAFAQRVADMLHGRSRSSPGGSEDSVAGSARVPGDAGRMNSSKANRGATSPGPTISSGGRRVSTSAASSDFKSKPHRFGRPLGRFVTPDVAKQVSEAGKRLMKSRVLKVANLGDRFCALAWKLTRDKEPAEDLLKMVEDLKRDTDEVWNGSSSLEEMVGLI